MEYAWDEGKVSAQGVYWGRGIWWRWGEMSESFRVEECLQNIFREGIEFLDKHVHNQPGKPFFLYLPLTAPHTPWVPDEAFKGKSSIDTYGDFVMQIDNHIDRIIKKVRELGIEENTIIVFSSDNGAPWPPQDIVKFGHNANWSRRGQKGDVWEGGHRIPLIIKWPAIIRKHTRYDHLVSLTDLYATFAELTGQQINENNGEDSFSLMEVINGNTEVEIRNSMIHQSGIYGIRLDGWKYIDGLGSGGFSVPRKVEPEPNGPSGQLYRIVSDSLESENLYLTNPEMVNMLRDEMQKQINQGYTTK
ncbi:N-acetylgalactosamine-6-O-sulfatase [subsurface metagenome]